MDIASPPNGQTERNFNVVTNQRCRGEPSSNPAHDMGTFANFTLAKGMQYEIDAYVPTILYDTDAPPYFDDPTPAVRRAMVNVAYAGDEVFVGRVFKSKEEARIKLAIHATQRKVHFKHVKSRPNIMHVICVSERCPRRVYLNELDNTNRFEVSEATLNHTCTVDVRVSFQKMASTEVICNMMKSTYLGLGTGPRPCELCTLLKQDYCINVSYWKAWRAREIAMDTAMDSAMGSYGLVRPYFDRLLETNPGSLVRLKTATTDGA